MSIVDIGIQQARKKCSQDNTVQAAMCQPILGCPFEYTKFKSYE